LSDLSTIDYITNILTEFIHIDNVYKIKNARGKRLEEVGEMLLEAEESYAFGIPPARELHIHKHIGDYTLFMVGLFPESLERFSPLSIDHIVDYIKAGKEAYYAVSEYRYGYYAELSPIFRRLSDYFECYTLGLNHVKDDIRRLGEPHLRWVEQVLAR